MSPYVYASYAWLGYAIGVLLGCAGIIAGHLLYHWQWCRRWDREHPPTP